MNYSQELAGYVDEVLRDPEYVDEEDLVYIKKLSRRLINEHKFVEDLCDIIGGDNAYTRFSKEEIIKMLQDMSTSASEWDDYQENLDVYDYTDYYPGWYQQERVGQL